MESVDVLEENENHSYDSECDAKDELIDRIMEDFHED